jgi:hypothetical protein
MTRDRNDPGPHGAPAAAEAGPCPTPDELAGFLEGRLTDVEADRTAAHAAVCPDCRGTLDDLEGDLPAAAPVPERAPPAGRLLSLVGLRRHAAAAAVLALVGAAGYALWHPRAVGPLPSSDSRLVAAARDLEGSDAVFRGFAPLSASELDALRDARERGGVALLGPVGVVLERRPTFARRPSAGTGPMEVSVAKVGGPTLWTRTTNGDRLAYPADEPALEPGVPYAWTASVEGAIGGKTTATRRFSVASPAVADAFARARALIDARAPADVRALLAAHWALRHELLEEARRPAEEHVRLLPDDALGRETLRAVRRRLGEPDEGPGR